MELKYQRLVLIPRRLMPVMDINTGQHQLPRKWRMLEQPLSFFLAGVKHLNDGGKQVTNKYLMLR
jgi:hypothetical protein